MTCPICSERLSSTQLYKINRRFIYAHKHCIKKLREEVKQIRAEYRSFKLNQNPNFICIDLDVTFSWEEYELL